MVSGYNSHWNRHNSYHEDIQKHIIGLPAGHFENNQEALQKLSTHFSLQLISENIQKHVIGLSADQFVNKSTALQQLLTADIPYYGGLLTTHRQQDYGLHALPEGTQKHIIGLSADQFMNKPAAMQELLYLKKKSNKDITKEKNRRKKYLGMKRYMKYHILSYLRIFRNILSDYPRTSF